MAIVGEVSRKVMAVAAFRSALPISRVSSSSSASRIPDKGHRKRKKELDQMGAWDASWDASSTLPPPIREDLSIARGTIIPEMSARGVGVCSSLGRRDYQEDRFSIKVSLLLVNIIHIFHCISMPTLNLIRFSGAH